MKRILIFSIFLVACSLGASAEKTWAQHERYAASNDTVKARMRMPELKNSILMIGKVTK